MWHTLQPDLRGYPFLGWHTSLVIYALAVIVTLSVTTAVVVVLIIRAPLWEEEEEGDESAGISFDSKERSEGDPDATTSVGAERAED